MEGAADLENALKSEFDEEARAQWAPRGEGEKNDPREVTPVGRPVYGGLSRQVRGEEPSRRPIDVISGARSPISESTRSLSWMS